MSAIISMSFKHPRLERDKPQIRLLRLLPREAASDTIRCSLHVVDLDDNPNYAALSYAWQPMNPQHDILINGEVISVGDNLWQFLSVAPKDLHDANMPIWIDQICIDQHDMNERNHQVSLMGRVYSQADRTFVWIGPEENNSDAGMSVLNELWNAETPFAAVLRKYSLSLPISRDEDTLFTSLFRRPYWTRLWIVPEFCLSPSLVLVCGTSTVNISDLDVDHISRAVAFLPPSVARLRRARNAYRQKMLFDVCTVLHLFSDMRCSIPHDTVFALLSLVDKRHKVPINYSISMERLVLQVLHNSIVFPPDFLDRRMIQTILSRSIFDPVALNLTSEVLVCIAGGDINFKLLLAGKDHGSEELSRICQEVIESTEHNTHVDPKEIQQYHSVLHGLNEPHWFLHRQFGRVQAVRGIPTYVMQYTPDQKRLLELQSLADKETARNRITVLGIEDTAAISEETWLETARSALQDLVNT